MLMVQGGGGQVANETSMLAVADGLEKQSLLDMVKIWQLDDWVGRSWAVKCGRFEISAEAPSFNHSL